MECHDVRDRTRASLLCELKEFHLSNFRVTMLNPDAAIVTYRADARAVIQGKEVSLKESVTAGWSRRNGRWLNVCAIGTPPREQQ